ncbi:hypothetical protein L1887_03161 [Cichorium endivia]|nr:hypothetical protein L1887_03161 [Cichorium endivia]
MAEHHRPREKITTELPSDILFFNILLRLPPKSILRFRYVSKQLHSLLSSPEFLNMHLHRVTNDDHQNHHKLLVLSNTTPCNFHTIDCELPEDGPSASRPLPFKGNPENIRIITSFNGLVCVGITKRSSDDKYSDLMLWNPLTGDYKRLHRSNSCEECYEVTPRASAFYGGENSGDLSAKFWRMDGDGDWTKVVTYQIPNCFYFEEPLHLMRNGNWLTYSVNTGFNVYTLDLVWHLNAISYSNIAYGREITPRAKYIETLVSPNR